MKPLIALLSIAILFTSCSQLTESRPEKIFTTIGLNSNTVNGDFVRIFKEIKGQGEAGRLHIIEGKEYKTTDSYQVYFKNRYSNFFDNYIENVKKLKVGKEDQKMIDKALEMFTKANEVYAKDFLPIAKMIDEKKPDAEIDAAILQLTETKGKMLENLRADVLDLSIPYAEKHGIEVKYLPSFK